MTHLRVVPDHGDEGEASPAELPPEVAVLNARAMAQRLTGALDDLVGRDALASLEVRDLLALHDSLMDLESTVAATVGLLASAVNAWIWAYGRREEHGAVAEIDGERYRATMAGGPSRSLKVPEQVALGHAIFERAVTETIRSAGLDPNDADDPQVTQLKIFGSVLDALIVGRADTPPAARLQPMARVLAAGLVDRETGEITPTPEGQIRWALDVENYKTPTNSIRRRTFTRLAAPSTEDQE